MIEQGIAQDEQGIAQDEQGIEMTDEGNVTSSMYGFHSNTRAAPHTVARAAGS